MGKNDTNYSDARLGLRQRAFVVPLTKDDVATTGTLTEAFITLPVKARVVGFGFQSAASDIVFDSGDTIELRTLNGTKLATWVAPAAGTTTIGSGAATQQAPETATEIAANKPMVVTVGSTPGASGSVLYFVDYEEAYL